MDPSTGSQFMTFLLTEVKSVTGSQVKDMVVQNIAISEGGDGS